MLLLLLLICLGIFEYLTEMVIDGNEYTHEISDYGVSLTIPKGAVKDIATLQFGVCLCHENFKFEDDCTPVTPIVWACIDQKLMKPAQLTLSHHIDTSGIPENDLRKSLSVLKADDSSFLTDGNFTFKKVDEKVEIQDKCLTTFWEHFCSHCVSNGLKCKNRYLALTPFKRYENAVYIDLCFVCDQPKCIEVRII